MEFSLSLAECKDIATKTGCSYIPLYTEILSDELTPIMVLRRLKSKSKRCFLLESAEHDLHFGRWSILGFDPKAEILLRDGYLTIKGVRKGDDKIGSTIQTSSPNEHIKKILDNYNVYKEPSLPFTGGLVGCFSYDYYRYSEPVLQNAKLEDSDFYDADLLLFDKVVLFDNYKQKVILVALVSTTNIHEGYETTTKILRKMKKLVTCGTGKKFKKLKLSESLKPRFDTQKYADMVERAKDYIYEGDIFQVVLSNPQRAKAKGSLFDVYKFLRSSNPSPYMFYFTSPYTELAGCSPETLVSVKEGVVRTYPIAGTRPRGKTPDDDKKIEDELLSDEKELSEHNMLVDLGRNDIGKISTVGSVKVTKYMNIERYSHVMHIASEVEGKLLPECSSLDALSSILPAGTLSGAPKIRACQIIDELEGVKRGIYGGAIGYIGFDGNMDTAIAIRLAYMKNGYVNVRSGGGIVADSVVQKEAEEYTNKAKAVVDAIYKAANSGLWR